MIEWQDEGTLLSVRPHGETAAIAEVLTAAHGRHLGVVRGGVSRRLRPVLQPGAELALRWQARLDGHLGAFTVEPLRSRMAAVMADRRALAGLSAALALLSWALPEREPVAALHARTGALLDRLGPDPHWPFAYLRWELALLDDLGFGLALDACAVTGAAEDLAFVSPRTGRAVSRAAAGDWTGRLLPLPPALRGAGEGPLAEVLDGLRTTGHFLAGPVAQGLERPWPAARARLAEALAR